MLKSDIFNRSSADGAIVSSETYNLIIGLVLCWGFLINWLIVRYVDTTWLLKINPWIFFIAYFASCFFGTYLFNASKEPAISFLGYNFVVVPFGLIVNMVVSRYEPNLVLQALQITAVVTIIMMMFGVAFPKFFQSIRFALFIALLIVILIELFQIFVLHIHSEWIDWAVALIFCGYIGYDWGRANNIPKTVDNAIDSAAAIYMDIINLFLRILRILGRRRR
jgi:FtsH-binding integral membrane protein